MLVRCPKCDGYRTFRCDDCEGTGKINDPNNEDPHHHGETCPRCRGVGRYNCDRCDGRGDIEVPG